MTSSSDIAAPLRSGESVGTRGRVVDPASARRRAGGIAWLAVALTAGCEAESDAIAGEPHPLCAARPDLCTLTATDAPVLGPPTRIAPSAALPAAFVSQVAHNNLDATWHDGRVFVAIRTAPNHFASPDTVLYVVSSPDLESWRFEGGFALGTDVREPQLVSYAGVLWLYYAVLGDNPLDFAPQGTRRHRYIGPDQWSEGAPLFGTTTIVWRIEEHGGQLHAMGYGNGAAIYDAADAQVVQQWWVSDDGESWRPRYGDSPDIRESGASEWDFVTSGEGDFLVVARNETGDMYGFGAHVCTAHTSAPYDWDCVGDPRKFDSPLMLGTWDAAWLLARRNVTESGYFNLDYGTPQDGSGDPYLRYQIDYWQHPKRCSVWRVGSDRTVTFALDLPSAGDTCFPEAIALGDGRYLVFNYTSPADEASDPSWLQGQQGPTEVYWLVMALPEE